jgi:spore coat polysaccharide biosynthesis protein SpsF
VVARLKASRMITRIVVATSVDATDDIIGRWCAGNSIDVFRGSLDDVLDRYYNAAREFGAGTIVRITADCPLLDPGVVDKVIGKFLRGGYDRVSSGGHYPDGLDTEVFSFEALERAHTEARLASEREHVTPYIWKRPEEFSLSSVNCEEDLSYMRWTVDDPEDFLFVTKIFDGLYDDKKVFDMNDILAFLNKRPELLEINSGTMRNEGYAKSLREDYIVNA